MKKYRIKAFLISCMFWLLPGFLGGCILAVSMSAHEYQKTARLAGALQEEKELSAALKITERSGEKNRILKKGSLYLKKYGYNKLGSAADNLPFTLTINLLLFEAGGCIVFFFRKREENYKEGRILELTNYLKSVDRGEAAVLTRQEDMFSYLEDEIYKTVAELICTKEKAVKDHQILSERIADIAHQLKTPLTSMSLMTELLEPAEKEEQEYLYRLKNQVERLKGLVEGLLALAKLDSHTIEFRKEKIRVEDLLGKASEPLSQLMERKQIQLEVECKEEIWMKVDRKWTAEALLNVLKNCVEYTPNSGKIKINCTQNPLYTELIMEDEGKGFSKEELPHLFERFYKGEQAAKDSAGIGLALAKLILEAQKGQISAENSPDGHAQFRIKMYIV